MAKSSTYSKCTIKGIDKYFIRDRDLTLSRVQDRKDMTLSVLRPSLIRRNVLTGNWI